MDYSMRTQATEEKVKLLEKHAIQKSSLPKIKDYLFKPAGAMLNEFHPNQVCIRLREFLEEDKPSTLIKITTTQTDTGYTDSKESLGIGKTQDLLTKARKLNLEKWGEISTVSTQFSLPYSQVLAQTLTPISTFLKIESETKEGLQKTLELLGVNKSEEISENAAVLLAKHKKLI